MKLLGTKILIEEIKETQTESGILLSSEPTKSFQKGLIAILGDKVTNPLLTHNIKVLFSSFSSTSFEKGKLIVDEEDIIAIIE